jgi:cob(I)alamin adenosyltransferase
MNESLPALTAFILPGGNLPSSYAHVARTVCRRAERLMVKINRNTSMDVLCVKYVNRLSDYLFVLSRKILIDAGLQEVVWKPRR